MRKMRKWEELLKQFYLENHPSYAKLEQLVEDYYEANDALNQLIKILYNVDLTADQKIERMYNFFDQYE